MSTPTLAPRLPVPLVSYGPFRLLEAVPWLMLATAFRILTLNGGVQALLAMVAASFAVFLAFLLATRRMIEIAGGHSALGELSFGQQMRLACRVLSWVLVLVAVLALMAQALGARQAALHLVYGFDGIAFGQYGLFGRAWSCALAAVVLIMVVQVGTGGRASLPAALRELALRWRVLLPAIALATLAQVAIALGQDLVRDGMLAMWRIGPWPQTLKSITFFVFVFGFAALRLWCTLAILTFALRASYRREQE